MGGSGLGAVVGGHVVLELVGVGAGGGLPVGDLVDGVEEVGEVLRLGVADFPVWWQAGLLWFLWVLVLLCWYIRRRWVEGTRWCFTILEDCYVVWWNEGNAVIRTVWAVERLSRGSTLEDRGGKLTLCKVGECVRLECDAIGVCEGVVEVL